MLMCKICIPWRLVVKISRDAMRILCLSLAGRWWRAEWETGQLIKSHYWGHTLHKLYVMHSKKTENKSPRPIFEIRAIEFGKG